MANGLAGLFGGTSVASSLSLYSAIFPALFGNGSAGAATLGTIADGGYLGTFGAPQYTSLSLPSGGSITLPPGSGNGGLILACQGTFTLGGSIVANGAAGGNGTNGASGAGGGTAGGGTGGAANTNVAGLPGNSPAKLGHGSLPNTSRGAAAGAYQPGSGVVASSWTLAADVGYGLTRMIDPATGLRLTTPQSTATYASIINTSTAFGTPSRSLPTNILSPAAPTFSLDLLPTGLAGLPGTNIAQDFQSCGGGGGGGGVIYIEANTIVFQSGHSIQANGGVGGTGTGTTGGSNATAGGSGGDGGFVILIANQFVGTPNISVSGGAPGTSASGTPAPLASLAGRFLMIQV